jgi:MFS family permease
LADHYHVGYPKKRRLIRKKRHSNIIMAGNTPKRSPLPESQKAIKSDEAEERQESKYGPHYKWMVLSNTTLGSLMAAIDSSIILISLPAIFNGLGVNPLIPSNIGLLLWMFLGYIIASAVIVVSVGRFADTFGRVKLYNLGFIIFASTSALIYASSYFVHGVPGALSIIVLRMFQALGGAFLVANSAAMITDAFPHRQRGLALGTNAFAYAIGTTAGLIIGGTLAAIDWHLIFMISVPVGIIGAIWSYLALHEIATIKTHRKLDIPGNVAFGAALALLLISITYGLLPYGNSAMGWGNPLVLAGIASGVILLILFVIIEKRAKDPMFKLELFKNKGFSLGIGGLFFGWLSRWGLQFTIVIWLQGIWLPLHGVEFTRTPLMAAIYMLPFAAGIFFSPLAGKLSDRYGPRVLATSGMLISGVGLLVLSTLPANFSLVPFLLITFIIGAGQGTFMSPNMANVMNSLPPEHRGAGSGMRTALQYSSTMFGIVIFFTLIVAGLSTTLSGSIYRGLVGQGVNSTEALSSSNIPPTAALFATFLGYNPLGTLLPQGLLQNLTATQRSSITGKEFFPNLISPSFSQGLKFVFYLAAALSFLAALLSALMGPDIYAATAKPKSKKN